MANSSKKVFLLEDSEEQLYLLAVTKQSLQYIVREIL